jgi:hypothetical protein
MSTINFPDNPTSGDLYSFGSKTWQWNGNYWGIYSGSTLSIVDLSYSANTGELWYTKSDLRWRQTDAFLDISTADSGDYLRFGAGNSDFKAYVTSNGFGINTQPVASAALEISATNQGFLPPRMTNTQITGITSPATGLMAYSTTDNLIVYYNGSNWMKITGVTTL